MFRSLSPFALSLPLLQSDPPGPSGNPPATPPADPPKPDEVTFDEKQQKKVNDLLAAERKRTEEATATRLQAERDEADRKAQAEAERKKQEEAGQYEEVKRSLEGERDGFKSRAESAESRLETLEKLATDRLTALLADIPKEIAELGPDESTPIEKRLEWAEKAAKAAGVTAPKSPGNGPNPPPANGHFDRDAATAKAKATGKYTI
jgi:hypothetical protein